MYSPRILTDTPWLMLVVFASLLLSAVGWWWWRTNQADRLRWFQKGQLGEHQITVVTSITAPEIQQGLSDRSSLGADAMFFPLQPRADHRFWMYHMQFPLDFVWVYEGKVVALHENVPIPPSDRQEDIAVVQPQVFADGVLEFPAGTIEQWQIKLGDSWQLGRERTRKVW